MTASITFTEQEQAMMIAMIKQLGAKSLDNKKLAQDLGISDKFLLANRLCRFRAKIARLDGGKSTSVSPAKAPTTPKNCRKNKPATSKKRKLDASDEEDNLTIKDIDTDSHPEGRDLNESLSETPAMKTPGRNARVMSFKEDELEIDPKLRSGSAPVSTSDEEA